ncbi:alpha-2,3 sialyltransferase, partial [Campylobacter novaezeelandiae]
MKDLIVAGNGPSLKNIDYQRLPRDYEVFRCNQFYFEDKYYLGKDIKIAFFNQSFFLEQIYTAKTLIKNEEYKIDNFVCSNFKLHSIYENHLNFIKYFNIFFPDANLGSDFLEKLKEFNAYICYNELYKDKRITSGIY